MRRLFTIALVGCLLLAALPAAALAGDPHAVRNRWAGVGIAASVLTLGGLLLGGLQASALAGPAPVVYSGPPVMYAPPVVYAPPPPVVYAPPPVVVYRGWVPPGHWRYHHR
jgi:hypothetical protein